MTNGNHADEGYFLWKDSSLEHFATIPHDTSAWVAKFNDKYYIAAADYGSNVCSEPLTIDKDTEEKINAVRKGSYQGNITITSNMLNTKVQKWVSKTDLETIQVTYELNKDSNEDN